MLTLENGLILLGAYLLGAVPTSVWLGHLFYGMDIREFGSGNAGATNTFRVFGYKAGIPVLILDVVKGWLAVILANYFGGYEIGTAAFVNFQLALGIAALLGHIFPVYVGFRGGKGIATLLGIIVAVHTPAALIALGVFMVILLLTKYISLSSMVAAVSFPVIVIVIFNTSIPSLIIFSLFIAFVVLFTHQKNIERLLRREESKIKFTLKRKNRRQEHLQ